MGFSTPMKSLTKLTNLGESGSAGTCWSVGRQILARSALENSRSWTWSKDSPSLGQKFSRSSILPPYVVSVRTHPRPNLPCVREPDLSPGTGPQFGLRFDDCDLRE